MDTNGIMIEVNGLTKSFKSFKKEKGHKRNS